MSCSAAPVHRPRTLLVPAAQGGAVVECAYRLLVAAQYGIGIAQVVPPARVGGVRCCVLHKDVHVTLCLAPAVAYKGV